MRLCFTTVTNVLLQCPDWLPNFTSYCWLAGFELQAILRQMHCMTPNDLEYYIRSKVRHIPNPNFSVLPYSYKPFSSFKPFWYKCPKWPQNDLEHCICKVKRYPTYVLLLILSSKFHCFALTSCFFGVPKAIMRQYTEWLQKWDWTLQGTCT